MTETKIYKKIIIFLVILFGTMWVTSCASQGVTSVDKTEESPIETAEAETLLVDITFEGGTGKA